MESPCATSETKDTDAGVDCTAVETAEAVAGRSGDGEQKSRIQTAFQQQQI